MLVRVSVEARMLVLLVTLAQILVPAAAEISVEVPTLVLAVMPELMLVPAAVETPAEVLRLEEMPVVMLELASVPQAVVMFLVMPPLEEVSTLAVMSAPVVMLELMLE
ncbi:hypothetical protein BDV35DRAFT_345256 [Aspergillus flavus]|uniref:Uncharacterized protein n=1 Tax=Aspergillus flavus TaxID=5059 RepID=A0A5N6H6B0_ASPFL|nr:hypothetical protein BDV35DRAFT_345256 [Aspergillus flavus]